MRAPRPARRWTPRGGDGEHAAHEDPPRAAENLQVREEAPHLAISRTLHACVSLTISSRMRACTQVRGEAPRERGGGAQPDGAQHQGEHGGRPAGGVARLGACREAQRCVGAVASRAVRSGRRRRLSDSFASLGHDETTVLVRLYQQELRARYVGGVGMLEARWVRMGCDSEQRDHRL